MMKRCVISLIVTLLLVCACSEEKRDDDAAARAAKEYYDHLVAGRYVEYLDGMAGIDSVPPSYREQLLTNAKQFVAQQRKDHGGIVDVRVVSAHADSLSNGADAFLMLCFGDSTHEEVVVPMVGCGGRWMMK